MDREIHTYIYLNDELHFARNMHEMRNRSDTGEAVHVTAYSETDCLLVCLGIQPDREFTFVPIAVDAVGSSYWPEFAGQF